MLILAILVSMLLVTTESAPLHSASFSPSGIQQERSGKTNMEDIIFQATELIRLFLCMRQKLDSLMKHDGDIYSRFQILIQFALKCIDG